MLAKVLKPKNGDVTFYRSAINAWYRHFVQIPVNFYICYKPLVGICMSTKGLRPKNGGAIFDQSAINAQYRNFVEITVNFYIYDKRNVGICMLTEEF